MVSPRDEQATKVKPLQAELISFKSWEERYSFCLSLGMFLNAGVSLQPALDALAQSECGKGGRACIAEIASSLAFRVSSGLMLSQAIVSLPKAFPKYVHRLVAAGERTGSLHEAFLKVAELERASSLARREMRGILWYPAAILVFAIVIGAVSLQALTSLLPFYESTGSYVVKYIQGAAALWNTISSPLALLLLGCAAAFFIYGLREETIQRGLKLGLRKFWHRIPGVRTLIRYSSNIQFCHALARLLEIGVPAASAIEPALLAADDALFDEKVRRAPEGEQSIVFHYRILRLFGLREDVRKGALQQDSLMSYLQGGGTLSEVLGQEDGLFLPQVISMVEVGQDSGRLPHCLKSAARMLEVEFQYRSQLFKSLIQPIVLCVSGAFVGLFAVVSLAPLMEVMNL
jgi:type II secretory pathway component PulF